MDRRSLVSWLWPIIPASLLTLLIAKSDIPGQWCPPYTTRMPPHPEQCLPTLVPSLTGADPFLVGLSWLLVGVAVYALLMAAPTFARARSPRLAQGSR